MAFFWPSIFSRSDAFPFFRSSPPPNKKKKISSGRRGRPFLRKEHGPGPLPLVDYCQISFQPGLKEDFPACQRQKILLNSQKRSPDFFLGRPGTLFSPLRSYTPSSSPFKILHSILLIFMSLPLLRLLLIKLPKTLFT